MSDEAKNEQAEPERKTINPLQDRALEAKEVPEVLDFLRENGTSILIGVGLAVVVFLGVSAYRNYKRSQETTAESMLFNSRAAEQFQQIIDQYPGSAAAPLAHLALAGQYFDEGQFELAQHVFGQFMEKYPDHVLRPDAMLGNIQCEEALGQYEDALDGYERFIAEHPNHYRVAVAEFGRARCLEQLGRLDEAKAVYEDYVVAHPDDRWSARAESSVKFIEMEQRKKPEGAEPSQAPETGAPPIISMPSLEDAVSPAVAPGVQVDESAAPAPLPENP